MLKPEILKTLIIVYEKLNNSSALWILSGSASLVLQGVDVECNNDIDILTDRDGTVIIDNILSEFREKSPDYSSTEKYRSYFGIYNVNGVKVEVMGEFQYKLSNGEWCKHNHLNNIIKRNFYGMEIPVLSLEQELIEYENLCRFDKADKIRECICKTIYEG